MSRKSCLLLSLLMGLFFYSSSYAVIYVDQKNLRGPWTGQSWKTAYQDLQMAIDKAEPKQEEIWVAQGIYYPNPRGDRSASFHLREGIVLYGGFQGTEVFRTERNWLRYITVLSGHGAREQTKSKNSIHVVIGANHARLDGFVITGGNALTMVKKNVTNFPVQHVFPHQIMRGVPEQFGGGLVNFHTMPTIANCLFIDNFAEEGGGIYNMMATEERPVSKNHPAYQSMLAPTLINVAFVSNYARQRGGAMANDMGTHPLIKNTIFIGNVSDGEGGAICNDFTSSPTFINALFWKNMAESRGGAMVNEDSSSPTCLFCTFYGNRAGDVGGAIYNGTHDWEQPIVEPVIINSILWADWVKSGAREVQNWHDDAVRVSYSVVQGGYEGYMNRDSDPFFEDAEKGNFKLKADSSCMNFGDEQDRAVLNTALKEAGLKPISGQLNCGYYPVWNNANLFQVINTLKDRHWVANELITGDFND